MKVEEVISQLESLKENSKSFIEEIEPESIWRDDIVALDYAISVLKKDLQPPSKTSPRKNTSSELYHENGNLETEASKETIKKIRLISEDELNELENCINRVREILKGVELVERD